MYGSKIVEKLNKLRSQDILCDVVLRFGNQTFAAHRAVLAASCEYFHVLFTTSMQERNRNEISVSILPSIAEDLLLFMYTGELNLSEVNSKDLLIAADYLMIEELKCLCEERIVNNLSVDNCMQAYSLAMNYNCKSLALKAEKLILNNFGSVITGTDFMHLEIQHFLRIISSNELVIKSEGDVFEAIISWVNYNPDERSMHIEVLFKCIRLFSVPVLFVTGTVAKNPLVRNNQACMSLVFKRIQSSLIEDDELSSQPPRKCLQKKYQAIVCLGGIASGRPLKRSLAYVPQQAMMTHLPDMSAEREEHVVVVGNNSIYVIGGMKTPTSIEYYKAQLNTWTTIDAILHKNAVSSAGVYVDDNIYIIGGKDGFECVSTVQCYNTSSQSVQMFHSLTFPRKALNAVTLDGYIYAIGGCTYDNDSLNTVERIQLESRNNECKWEQIASLNHKRKWACAHVSKSGKILVAGGYQDTNPTALNSCELYNPVSNEWLEICSLVLPRAAAGIGCIHNKMYILGGRSNRVSTDTVEYYDEQSDKWSLMDIRLPDPVAWIQCGVLSLPRPNDN